MNILFFCSRVKVPGVTIDEAGVCSGFNQVTAGGAFTGLFAGWRRVNASLAVTSADRICAEDSCAQDNVAHPPMSNGPMSQLEIARRIKICTLRQYRYCR